MKIKKISQDLSRLFFYFFVFLVPFRIDAVFFGPQIFISGFFDPFLVHSICLSDIFFLLGLIFLFLAVIFDVKKAVLLSKVLFAKFPKVQFFALLFVCSYIFSLIFSIDHVNSILYTVRAFQFFFFSILIIGKFLDFKKILQFLIAIMSLQAVLGIFQFLLQGDLGLHFFGEPLLDVSLKNLAKISLFGSDFLRAYGTFSHPNIFGAYLVFAILGLFYIFPKKNILLVSLFSLFIAALLFTFSRSAVLALVISMILCFRKNNFWPILFSIFLTFFVFAFAPMNTLVERLVHYAAAFKMFIANPLGVGAGDFTLALPQYVAVKLDPWQFQPVHNIFVLVLSELGILGIAAFFALLFAKMKQLLKSKGAFRLLNLSFFASFLIFGLFDHYLISLYQGQLLLWLTISLDSR